MTEIQKNMLRERASGLPEVTDEMWQQVSEEHRELVDEYFDANPQLSSKSVKQYTSALHHFFWWVHIKLKDKPIYEITKRDFIKYRGYLQNHGLSSSALKFKQSAVSSLNNFIENIIADDDERYKVFRNFTRGLPAIPPNKVYEKVKVTREEYELMMKELEEHKDYMGMAWLAVAFNVGARRAEIPQFKSEIANYDFGDKTFVMSHTVRGKGKTDDGKPLKFMINKEAMYYIKLWLEKRGYDHEYIFTIKQDDNIKRISDSWANYFCTNILSPILGRRINVHIFKASCITHLLMQGVDIALVSKYVAQHEQISTTVEKYDLRDFDEERNEIFS